MLRMAMYKLNIKCGIVFGLLTLFFTGTANACPGEELFADSNAIRDFYEDAYVAQSTCRSGYMFSDKTNAKNFTCSGTGNWDYTYISPHDRYCLFTRNPGVDVVVNIVHTYGFAFTSACWQQYGSKLQDDIDDKVFENAIFHLCGQQWDVKLDSPKAAQGFSLFEATFSLRLMSSVSLAHSYECIDKIKNNNSAVFEVATKQMPCQGSTYSLEIKPADTVTGIPAPNCPFTGFYLDEEICLSHGPAQYFNVFSNTLANCPEGQYQDGLAQTSCKTCLSGLYPNSDKTGCQADFCLEEELFNDSNAIRDLYNDESVVQSTCRSGYMFSDKTNAKNFTCSDARIWDYINIHPHDRYCLLTRNPEIEVAINIVHENGYAFTSACAQQYGSKLQIDINNQVYRNAIQNLCGQEWDVTLYSSNAAQGFSRFEATFNLRLRSSASLADSNDCIHKIKNDNSAVFEVSGKQITCQGSSYSLEVKPAETVTGTPSPNCPVTGFYLDAEICLSHGPAQYFNILSNTVANCTEGQYQDDFAQTSCKTCLSGQYPNSYKTGCQDLNETQMKSLSTSSYAEHHRCEDKENESKKRPRDSNKTDGSSKSKVTECKERKQKSLKELQVDYYSAAIQTQHLQAEFWRKATRLADVLIEKFSSN